MDARRTAAGTAALQSPRAELGHYWSFGFTGPRFACRNLVPNDQRENALAGWLQFTRG